MEHIDVYFPEFARTGTTIVRGEPIPEGKMVMVVFVCMFDEQGRLLIQQRDPRKSFGGKWDVTCGGAVSAGETSTAAAARELSEEMGVSVKEGDLTKILSLYYDTMVHDIFTLEKTIPVSALTLQKGEVVDAKWVTREEIDHMIETGEFLKVHKEFLDLLFRMKTKRGIME